MSLRAVRLKRMKSQAAAMSAPRRHPGAVSAPGMLLGETRASGRNGDARPASLSTVDRRAPVMRMSAVETLWRRAGRRGTTNRPQSIPVRAAGSKVDCRRNGAGRCRSLA